MCLHVRVPSWHMLAFFSLFLMWARSFSEKPEIGIRGQQRFNIGPNTNTTGCYILRAWGPA